MLTSSGSYFETKVERELRDTKTVISNNLLQKCSSVQPLSSGATFTNMVQLKIPAWISNYMTRKVWDEITYPFLNFNGCTVEV